MCRCLCAMWVYIVGMHVCIHKLWVCIGRCVAMCFGGEYALCSVCSVRRVWLHTVQLGGRVCVIIALQKSTHSQYLPPAVFEYFSIYSTFVSKWGSPLVYKQWFSFFGSISDWTIGHAPSHPLKLLSTSIRNIGIYFESLNQIKDESTITI